MKRSAVLLLAGILLSVPASALAADYSAKPMSRVSAFNWTGFYAGVHAGYAWNEIDGWFGGGQIGFNMQASGSPLVWGIELDSAFSNIGDSVTVPGANASTNADYFGTLRGRVGASMERTLLYVTGGLAWANNELKRIQAGRPAQSLSRISAVVGPVKSNIFMPTLVAKIISAPFRLEISIFIRSS